MGGATRNECFMESLQWKIKRLPVRWTTSVPFNMSLRWLPRAPAESGHKQLYISQKAKINTKLTESAKQDRNEEVQFARFSHAQLIVVIERHLLV